MKINWEQLKKIIRNKENDDGELVIISDEEIIEAIYRKEAGYVNVPLGKGPDGQPVYLDGRSYKSGSFFYFMTKREDDGYLMSYKLSDFVTDEELDKVLKCHCCSRCGECHCTMR